MSKSVKYPIGEQDFKSLRDLGFLYVDKTHFIEKLVNGSKYYFLARPRRFGKSLFLSTLQYFFEGKRELFKGLYIDSADWEWEEYPVLRLDLNTNRFSEEGKLEDVLENRFKEWETKYELPDYPGDYSQRFKNIISAAHNKTGKQVVILVDEYDKPLVGNLKKNKLFEYYRAQLASIYSNFKSSAEHIRLVFLTGVSRFSKLSVFSDLNNLKDITFSDRFADVCGITEKELYDNFEEGISELALCTGKSYQKACALLKRNYDGYRFAERGSDIYNPWSILNAMDESRIRNYWTLTGTPTLLAEVLKERNEKLSEIFETTCREEDLLGMDLTYLNTIALLYQTGYLTIKSYNRRLRRYRLGIPNEEVKVAFFRDLIPYYQKDRSSKGRETLEKIVDSLYDGQPEMTMRCLQIYFAGIDYSLKMENENNFHNAMFLLFNLLGLETKAEVHTSDGRIDLEVETDDYIYIIELKYDHSAEEALRQIEEKKYYLKYELDSRKIFLIGASFNAQSRRIDDWKIISKS